jgi:hypothetical protein
MTQDMEKEPMLQMGSDKMILRHVYDELFAIKFPDRSALKRGFQPDRKAGTNLVYRWFQDKKKHWSRDVLPWIKAET